MDERIQQLETALRAAHAAGDIEAARRFAAEIVRLRNEAAAVAAGPRNPPPDSGFTLARDPSAVLPTGRDVSPEALAAATVAPAVASSVPLARPAAPSMREQGRAAAEARAGAAGRVGAALQGFGSFVFGAGTPATATSVFLSRLFPGGAPAISPGEAMEYARGIREGSYAANPGAYRVGAAGGLAAAGFGTTALLRRAPAAVQSVFSLQAGQTLRNILRLSAAGAASAGTVAASEEGIEAVPTATAIGAVAGPLGAGIVRGGAAGVNALRRAFSPTSSAVRILAQRLGEPAAAVANRLNAFVATMGRMPRLVEILRRETAEELGEISQQRFVGTEAADIFRNAEEAAALARPAEMGRVIRGGRVTSSVRAQEAIAEPVIEETADVLGRRVRSTETAQIGRRDVQMNRVMDQIGGQQVPLSDEIVDVITHPDVQSSLDPGLRRGVNQAIEAGQALGTITLPVRAWEAIRQDLAARAGPGAGQIYARLRDRVRDYVGERVPEYARALQEFGRRTDVARGTTAGRAALTQSSREFADAVRTAGGGTPGQAIRPGVRVAEQAGMRVGARTALADALSGTPEQARRYMTRLARDRQLQANLREVLSATEIAQLERLAARFGRRLDLRAGVATGRRVMSRGTGDAFQAAVDEAASSPAGAAGVRAGARGALAEAAEESPRGAVSTAQRLAEDPGLARRVETALGVPEALRLQRVGQTMTRAAENLARAAPRVTNAQLRARAASEQVREAISGVVIAGGRASGAFQANFISSVLQRVRMSRRAATRLAELATDPSKTHQVINLLRSRYGLSPEAIGEIYTGAAIAAGVISQ